MSGPYFPVKISELPSTPVGDLANAAVEISQGGTSYKAPAQLSATYAKTFFKSKSRTSPPASPSEGDRYIVASGGTGAWASQDGQAAEWLLDGSGAGAWFFSPVNGVLYIADENTAYSAINGSLQTLASTFKAAALGAVVGANAAALPAFTYANGTLGVGATMTANANGAFPSLDGHALSVGNRFWHWDYTGNGGTNIAYGIYTLTSAGSGGTPWVATRATDADVAAELGQIGALILNGTNFAGYTLSIPLSASSIIVGTTALPVIPITSDAAIAAETARAEAAEALLQGQLVLQGVNPPGAGSQATLGNTFTGNAAISNTGVLKTVELYATDAALVFLVAVSIGGGNMTLEAISGPVNLGAAAITTVTDWNPWVEAGWWIGVWSPSTNAPDYIAGVGAYNSCAGLVGGGVIGASTTNAVGSGLNIQMLWTVETGIEGESIRARGVEDAIKDTTVISQGINPPVATGTHSTAAFTRFSHALVEADGLLSELSFFPAFSGQVTLAVASYDPVADELNVEATKDFLAVGGVANVVKTFTPFVKAGWYVGVYSASVQNPDYLSGQPVTSYGCAGLVGVGTARIVNVGLEFEIGFKVIPGLSGQLQFAINRSNVAEAGIGLLDDADPTGVVDAAAIFSAAQLAHPNPNVPPASPNFSLTSILNSGWGLWGTSEAEVNVGGVSLAMPEAPERPARLLALRARLMSQIYSGAALICVGDSITNGAYASTTQKSWVGLLTRFANLGIALDEAVFCNFDQTDVSDGPGIGSPLFAGFTISGSTVNGTAGPVSKSLLLQPAQTITFTGAYERIDVTYNQGLASSLAFAFNGTNFATPAIGAGIGLDLITGPTATGHAGSGTYRITNTGANAVEITSIVRLGVKAGGSPPRLVVCRFAHGGYQFPSYGAGQIQSMLRIATAVAGGTNHFLVPALGTNDEAGAGQSYAALYALVTTFLGIFKTPGAGLTGLLTRNILPIMPWRWNAYPGGASFEQGNAAIRDAFLDGGVTQFAKTDGLDFIAFGLTQTGDGHPSDLGMFVVFNSLVDALVAGS